MSLTEATHYLNRKGRALAEGKIKLERYPEFFLQSVADEDEITVLFTLALFNKRGKKSVPEPMLLGATQLIRLACAFEILRRKNLIEVDGNLEPALIIKGALKGELEKLKHQQIGVGMNLSDIEAALEATR